MTDVTTTQVDELVERVRNWPADARLELAQGVLGTLRSSNVWRQRRSLKDLLGIMKLDRPLPTDAECRQILEDELIGKFGG